MRYLTRTLLALLALAALAAAGIAGAQPYPTRSIRLIAGYAPGGSTDTIARIVAGRLSETLGQQVVVENRVGASGTIGSDLVAKSAPDGYTALVGDIGGSAIAATLYSKLPYDPYKDFEHVSVMVTFPLVIIVPAGSRLTSFKQIIDDSRARPGSLSYGSQGVGSPAHLFAELMNLMANVKTVHVPYKGGAPALTGLLSQEVDFAITAVSTATAQIAAGKVRALAVTSAAPTPRLPGVPPMASVLPGFDAINFHSLHLPAHTPRAIVDKLYRETVAALQRPEVKARLDDLSMDVKGSTPEECAAFIRSEVEKWGKVVKATGARAD